MQRLAGAAAALAAIVFTSGTPAVAQTPLAGPEIAITGSGTVTRAPDQARLSFTIETNDDVAARATAANQQRADAVRARIVAAGVPADRIAYQYYSVNFVPKPPAPNPQFAQRYGYVVTRSLGVTLDDVTRVGAVIDAAIGGGVTSLGGVSFGFRDPRAVQRAALAAAYADAQAQAQALSQAAGLHLGPVVRIGDETAPQPRPGPFAIGRTLAAAAPTEIQASPVDVSASVHVVWSLRP